MVAWAKFRFSTSSQNSLSRGSSYAGSDPAEGGFEAHPATRTAAIRAAALVTERTALSGDDVVTNGGRVLCVVGLGSSVASAQARAYERVDLIGWRNRYFRKDIGHRAIDRA